MNASPVKAFAHVHGRSAQPSERNVIGQAAQSSAPSGVVATEAPLTKADVQGMIQAALAQQFPAKTRTSEVLRVAPPKKGEVSLPLMEQVQRCLLTLQTNSPNTAEESSTR